MSVCVCVCKTVCEFVYICAFGRFDVVVIAGSGSAARVGTNYKHESVN